ncbi:chromosome partitioning protein [Plantactinospora sp. GCM10030261]|uniref:MinD/ParA family ATP-binding protein n=1 Tax=Plantactinospora sp. GCM10030261 TaxID=3273420 RepID=UPI00361EDA64
MGEVSVVHEDRDGTHLPAEEGQAAQQGGTSAPREELPIPPWIQQAPPPDHEPAEHRGPRTQITTAAQRLANAAAPTPPPEPEPGPDPVSRSPVSPPPQQSSTERPSWATTQPLPPWITAQPPVRPPEPPVHGGPAQHPVVPPQPPFQPTQTPFGPPQPPVNSPRPPVDVPRVPDDMTPADSDVPPQSVAADLPTRAWPIVNGRGAPQSAAEAGPTIGDGDDRDGNGPDDRGGSAGVDLDEPFTLDPAVTESGDRTESHPDAPVSKSAPEPRDDVSARDGSTADPSPDEGPRMGEPVSPWAQPPSRTSTPAPPGPSMGQARVPGPPPPGPMTAPPNQGGWGAQQPPPTPPVWGAHGGPPATQYGHPQVNHPPVSHPPQVNQPQVNHGPAPQWAYPQTQGRPATPDVYDEQPWAPDPSVPTAEEFARRRAAKPAEPVAEMGVRAVVNKLGLVRLAPSRHEQEIRQDVEMVRRNFGGLRQVTVVNPKGGAGKTVAILLLAMTFGQKRGGYVLAWDNNETQGTLGMRAQQDFHHRTVRDLLRDLGQFQGAHGRIGDLSQYVRAQGAGMFDVLASDESATGGEMLTADAFAEIREVVSRFYKLIFVDTGNNVRAQNWQAAIDATDQLLITMSARNDSAETAARMLDHLEQSGRHRLVRQAVTVVSMPPSSKEIDLPPIQRHFAARTRAVLLAPYERSIDTGEPLRYGSLSSATKDAWLKIAAAVAEGL